jgi:hypothetical protein
MAEEVREVLNLLNEKLSGLFPYRWSWRRRVTSSSWTRTPAT